MSRTIFNLPYVLGQLFAVVHTAHADGDGPPRALTPAEKTFFARILGTIDLALPPAPEQWAATEKPSTAPPKDVAEGSEKGAFMVRYNGQWFDQSQRNYFRSNWREGMPHPSAKNMIIEVRASDQRAEAYLRAVQWDVLKGLLAQ